MSKLTDRFIRYVKIDTQSDDERTTFPSTAKQFDLADVLYQELLDLGITEVTYDRENCYVYASIPSNLPADQAADVPAIGFIAHMDTSPEITDTDVKPRLVAYEGDDILLNEEKQIVLSPVDYPQMNDYIGKTLIVTDGTTLLGADDKAGVAEIMTAASELMAHPEIPHGTVKIAFTPDEEVGGGMDHFDVETFGAKYAYTLDGGPEGELEYETFNAAAARITITGKSIHPGDAKNRMVNAVQLTSVFMNQFPAEETPSHTEGYEGFYHCVSVHGSIEHAELRYIIRDHDRQKFDQRKEFMKEVCAFLNKRFGEGTFQAEITDSYYNMKEMIEPEYHLIENAQKVMTELGIQCKIVPVRGGTDGSRLSYMGVPCPNLFTGGHNYHGRFEYACAESMEKAVQVILGIVRTYAK